MEKRIIAVSLDIDTYYYHSVSPKIAMDLFCEDFRHDFGDDCEIDLDELCCEGMGSSDVLLCNDEGTRMALTHEYALVNKLVTYDKNFIGAWKFNCDDKSKKAYLEPYEVL